MQCAIDKSKNSAEPGLKLSQPLAWLATIFYTHILYTQIIGGVFV